MVKGRAPRSSAGSAGDAAKGLSVVPGFPCTLGRMFATTARRSTAFLLFAALQFVVLTSVAMRLYPDYRFGEHFLSVLGATRTWDGVANHQAAIVFAIAVATLGAAMIVFAASWRDYAFARGRARGLGVASQVCGTSSGLAFIGVAVTPIDRMLEMHNALVVGAFVLLFAFAACTTVLWWRNGAPHSAIGAGALYAAMLAIYLASAGWAATDLSAHLGVLVVGQKIIVYVSMAYVVFLTLTIRRRTG